MMEKARPFTIRPTHPDSILFGDRRKMLTIFVMAAILLIVSLIAMTLGVYRIPVTEVYAVLLSHIVPGMEVTRLHDTIVWSMRFPRILLAILVGIALASAGAVYQGCFRNPLVEPFILGVSAGAAFGAGLGIVIPHFFLSIQISAFLFGAVAVVAASFLARMNGKLAIVPLILAGVIIGSVFDGMVSILKYVATDAALRTIVFWIMGGFYYASWSDIMVNGPLILGSFAILILLGWKLNILSMGDEEARTLGVNPDRFKVLLIALATLITAVAVSTVGIIAWVGLMMPHATRMIVGPDHRYVIPVAGLLGAIYLIVCDTLARTLIMSEIPVGIITSIIGAPYLFYLLRTRGKWAFGEG
jgi:iron complex transport system permease protein